MIAKQKTLLTLFMAVLLTLCLSQAAYGQSAKALLSKGNKLFSNGDYQAAYKVYQDGYKLQPLPVFLRSMGFSQLKLFQHEKARAHLQEYLKKFPKAKDRARIVEVIKSLEVVVKTRVSVTSTPPGAELFFDSEAGGTLGTTPFSGTIEPGNHILILKAPWGHLTTKAFKIAPGQSLSLDLNLEVPLEVTSTPEGASVHLDDASSPSIGTTPVNEGITPGKHTIYLKMAGYKPFNAAVEAKQGTPVQVSAQLKLGLRVTSVPPGATVMVDGQAVSGSTPLDLELPAGKHTIVINLSGFKAFSREVMITPGTDTALDATLEGGLLTMRVNVEGAKVKVGDIDLGTAPLEQAQVPLGSHEVVIEHPGRRTWKHPLVFDDAELVQADVQLAGPSWPIWVAGGATLAGVVMTGVGLGVAIPRYNDANEWSDANKQQPGLAEIKGWDYRFHHLATAGIATTLVGAATGFAYWYFWGRSHETIKRTPAVQAASR